MWEKLTQDEVTYLKKVMQQYRRGQDWQKFKDGELLIAFFADEYVNEAQFARVLASYQKTSANDKMIQRIVSKWMGQAYMAALKQRLPQGFDVEVLLYGMVYCAYVPICMSLKKRENTDIDFAKLKLKALSFDIESEGISFYIINQDISLDEVRRHYRDNQFCFNDISSIPYADFKTAILETLDSLSPIWQSNDNVAKVRLIFSRDAKAEWYDKGLEAVFRLSDLGIQIDMSMLVKAMLNHLLQSVKSDVKKIKTKAEYVALLQLMTKNYQSMLEQLSYKEANYYVCLQVKTLSRMINKALSLGFFDLACQTHAFIPVDEHALNAILTDRADTSPYTFRGPRHFFRGTMPKFFKPSHQGSQDDCLHRYQGLTNMTVL